MNSKFGLFKNWVKYLVGLKVTKKKKEESHQRFGDALISELRPGRRLSLRKAPQLVLCDLLPPHSQDEQKTRTHGTQ